MLEVKELSKSFGGLHALNKVNLRVNRGEIVGLIGPNGSGKTVLLNCVTNVYPLNSGKIIFDGEDITGLPAYRIASMGISRTFQRAAFFTAEGTIFLNMLIAQHLRTKGNLWDAIIGSRGSRQEEQRARDKALECLDNLGLTALKDSPVTGISHYSAQALALGIAIAAEPQFLALDELMAGLNMEETAKMIDILLRLRERGLTILIIEHIMSVITQMCDRVVVLNFGNKIAEGTLHEVVNNEEVKKVYFGEGI